MNAAAIPSGHVLPRFHMDRSHRHASELFSPDQTLGNCQKLIKSIPHQWLNSKFSVVRSITTEVWAAICSDKRFCSPTSSIRSTIHPRSIIIHCHHEFYAVNQPSHWLNCSNKFELIDHGAQTVKQELTLHSENLHPTDSANLRTFLSNSTCLMLGLFILQISIIDIKILILMCLNSWEFWIIILMDCMNSRGLRF